MISITQRTKTKSRRGQAISEYLILTALIAVGSIAVVQILGSNLQRKLGKVANSLAGASRPEIKGQTVTEEQYKVRDLGDFTDAIKDTSSQ
jgi:Flp pilus assembly pilin Flp